MFCFWIINTGSTTVETESIIQDFENEMINIINTEDIDNFFLNCDIDITKGIKYKEEDLKKFIKDIEYIKPTKQDKAVIENKMKDLENTRKAINKELADYREEIKLIQKYIKE